MIGTGVKRVTLTIHLEVEGWGLPESELASVRDEILVAIRECTEKLDGRVESIDLRASLDARTRS